MAKIKLALRALDEVLDQLPDHIAKLAASSGLKPVDIELEFTGSIAVDKDGGLDAGGEASGSVTEIASGDSPVTIRAGFGSKWDNQGGTGWKIRVKFG